jgi:predicted DNA-binding protein with PD1-like motif
VIPSSDSKTYVFRLLPHQDLKRSIMEFARIHDIEAGIVLTCVGSLEHYHLRFANQKEGSMESGHFEIVSLAGTFNKNSCHLHISISDKTGKTTGGHLLDGNLVFTTAEIAIAHLTDLSFQRVHDDTYGYAELTISSKN